MHAINQASPVVMISGNAKRESSITVKTTRGMAGCCLLTLRAIALLSVAALSPVTYAQDYWNQRPAIEWTPQEARVMLVWSPWARPTKLQWGFQPSTIAPGNKDTLSAPHVGSGSARQYERERALGDTTTPVQDRFFLESSGPKYIPLVGFGWGWGSDLEQSDPFASKSIPAVLRTRAAEDSPEAGGISLPEDVVIVLWESALPVQDAKRRLGIEHAIDDRLADNLIISVIGYPYRFDADQAAPTIRQIFLESATLILKRKKRIKPRNLQITENGENVILRFFFSRRRVALEREKEITFRFQFGPNLVESKFVLKEMSYKKKLAL